MRYVVYVGVAHLAPSRANEVVDKVKTEFNGFFKESEKVVYLPVASDNDVRVLMIPE